MDLVQRLHVRPARTSDAPRSPFPPVAVCSALAALAFGLGATAELARTELWVAPLSLGLLGLLLDSARALEQSRLRRHANAWIARGHDDARAWYGWRIAELTAPHERRVLARSLRSVVDDLAPGRLPGTAPLNRAALARLEET
jgi:hypothetical protein